MELYKSIEVSLFYVSVVSSLLIFRRPELVLPMRIGIYIAIALSFLQLRIESGMARLKKLTRVRID